MITYDHEKFIARAIESALMQKANFDCEIVIGEDSSAMGSGRLFLNRQRNKYKY